MVEEPSKARNYIVVNVKSPFSNDKQSQTNKSNNMTILNSNRLSIFVDNNNDRKYSYSSSSLRPTEHSTHTDSKQDHPRPVTARSLPNTEQTTSISKQEPQKTTKLINNVSSKKHELDNDNPSLTRKYSIPNSARKTNLDQFLDYSISPFTTKYEILGKKVDDDCNVRKSRSVSNNLNIVLPSHVTIVDEPNKTNFYRITEVLYSGNMNSIKNERKMCKLNIEYLIDMTNMRPDDLNRQTLGKLPCLCNKQHSRLYLTIQITDTSFKSLFNAFTEVNKFIQRARKASNEKKVLIFGKEILSSQVICAGAQYLMVEYEMNLETALRTMTQKNYPTIKANMDRAYMDYLREFEAYLKHMSVSLYGNTPFKFNESFSEDSSSDFGCTIKLSKQGFGSKKKGRLILDESNLNDDEEEDEDELEEEEILIDNNGKSKVRQDDFRSKIKVTQKNFSKLLNADEIENNLNKRINQKNQLTNSNLKLAWM